MKTTKQPQKIRRIKKRYNRGKGATGSINELASLTKQNDSMTIREILHRSIQGIEYHDFKTPFYEDEAHLSNYEFNKINNMDLDDKLRLYKEIGTQTRDLTNQIEKHKTDMEHIEKQQQAETLQRLQKAESIAKGNTEE